MDELKRRQLAFDDFSQVWADIQNLLAQGYTRVGKWSLGPMCDHLALALDGSIDGFAYMPPWYFRIVARQILPVILWRKRFPTGAKLPERFEPTADISDEIGAQRFAERLGRFENHHGAMALHPFFGKLSNQRWRKLHLIHCAHHLSFLLPEQK
jgi:hypothetical protein